jgi:FixJ family two-component response regulator
LLRGGPIHLLLSDVVMPSMHGTELAALVCAERPGTPVLFMSGYADGLMDDRGVLPDDITVLPKPFTTNELLAAVRTAIATSARGNGPR